MKNSQILMTIGGAASVIGGLISVGGVLLRKEAREMLSAVNGLGSLFGVDYNSLAIWEGKLQKANITLATGLILLGIGIIVIIAGYLKGNEVRNPECTFNTDLGAEFSAENIGDKLRELNDLKEQGLISEEEYSEKRKKILDSM